MFDTRKYENDNSLENTYIIAEAGSNHNGDIDIAYKLIDIATEAGADCVKFQSVNFETLTSDYKNEELKKAINKITLDKNWYEKLSNYCLKKGIDFMSTPTYERAVDELQDAGTKAFKIASMDLTNIPFLRYVARKNIPIILSRGMSTLSEIDIALRTIKEEGNDQICLLHCVAEYPTLPKMLNLNQIPTLYQSLGIPVGFSDHTESITIPSVARALGAKIIEKHFTYDRSIEGFDHFYSLDPKMLKECIKAIRDTEESLGSNEIKPYETEWELRKIYPRSIVASKDIKSGQNLTKNNITTKRPGSGISPIHWDNICGRVAKKDISKNHIITYEDLI